MNIHAVGILRLLVRAILFVFGRRLGRVRLLQTMFRQFASVFLPTQYVIASANGYKLGMVVGGGKGFDGECLSLLFGNGYEPQMTKTFKAIVKPDMNVVDVGAHIGYYTILASRLVGKGGMVLAFEPEPENYAELVGNIRLNECGNILAVQKAIGEKNGKARLYLYGQHSGQRSLVDIGKESHRTIGVDVISLDRFLDNQRVDVVKIDVDGGEMKVLMGMRDLLDRNPQVKIFTEVWETGLGDAGFSCADYWNLLSNHGFRYIYLLDDRKGESIPMGFDGLRFYLDRFGGANWLCSRSAIAKD